MQERVPNGSGAANGSELPYILNGGRREYQGSGGAGMHGSGASVSTVARRYDLKSNMVFRWRREVRRGLLNAPSLSRTEAFAPVGVIDEQGKLALPPKPAVMTAPTQETVPSAKPLPVPVAVSSPRAAPTGVIDSREIA